MRASLCESCARKDRCVSASAEMNCCRNYRAAKEHMKEIHVVTPEEYARRISAEVKSMAFLHTIDDIVWEYEFPVVVKAYVGRGTVYISTHPSLITGVDERHTDIPYIDKSLEELDGWEGDKRIVADGGSFDMRAVFEERA